MFAVLSIHDDEADDEREGHEVDMYLDRACTDAQSSLENYRFTMHNMFQEENFKDIIKENDTEDEKLTTGQGSDMTSKDFMPMLQRVPGKMNSSQEGHFQVSRE